MLFTVKRERIIACMGVSLLLAALVFSATSGAESPEVTVEYAALERASHSDSDLRADWGVDINNADEDTLGYLSGIGEVLAERIVAYRDEHGGFSELSEIMEVSGVGESVYADIKDYIYLGEYDEDISS